MKFQRVLFPVDLSERCREVAPYVKALALRFESEVVMLHVLQFFPVWYGPDPAPAFLVADQLEALRNQQRAEFEGFLREEFAGLPVRRKLLEGDPATEIVNYAQAEEVSLIMMPTQGYGPFRALLLGSVTAKVLHDVKCPVWTAVHTEQALEHPPERWRRILCSVEAKPEAARVVEWAADLAEGEGAQLCIVHAIEGVNTESPWPDASTFDRYLEEERKKISKVFQEEGINRPVSLVFGAPEKVVREAATNWNADLVVIGRGALQKPLRRLRSHAYEIIRESPCPVISL